MKVADRYISHAAEVFACLLLIPVLAIFFLRDGDHIADAFTRIVFPEDRRETVRAVTAELHNMLTSTLEPRQFSVGCRLLSIPL